VVVSTAFTMTTAIAYASQQADARDAGSGIRLVLPWLVGLVLCGALTVRRRFPVQVAVATAVGALVLPLDSTAALVALTWVIARRPSRTAWLCGALVAAATAAALTRDRLRSPGNVILSIKDQATGEVVVFPVWAFVLVGLVVVAIAIGVGLARRWRESARTAVALQREQEQVADHLRTETTHLRTEVTRQEEREVIAREVHDTVAHQLSLVSLRAAALEVSTDDDGEVREAAQTMRAAAHQALDEMRQLIAVLRSPDGGPSSPAPGLALGDLPAMLDAATQAGARVRSSVFVSDAGQAPPALTRAVYRIVQEALTNALKHAPGSEVVVEVRAEPGPGVRIRVQNALSGQDVGPRLGVGGDSGSGIIGMHERAALLGGTLVAAAEGGRFVVTAELPWSTRPGSVAGVGART
jgi:signal transduction histidine kinase